MRPRQPIFEQLNRMVLEESEYGLFSKESGGGSGYLW